MDKFPAVPPHIPADLVFDFDIYADPRLGEDIQATMAKALSEAPDIFYTPANGGHWLVRRYDLIEQIGRMPEVFSNREMQIPRIPNPPRYIPLSLDPPENVPFRQALTAKLSPKAVRDLQPHIREWAAKIVGEVADKGECDFVDDVSVLFPISIFMELMGAPLERLREFRELIELYFRTTVTQVDFAASEARLLKALSDFIETKRQHPADDLTSHLLALEVHGRLITADEMLSMVYILFLGGMDTVTNVLAFAFRQLAKDPELQQRLVDDPARIPDFVDEAVRCFGVATLPRIVKRDADLFGCPFRKDDMVLGMLPISGRDDRVNADPMRFDIDRPTHANLTFSTGPHLCVGQGLARAEMNIFTEEWLKRIPRFALKPGVSHGWRAGTLFAIDRLPLVWG